MQDILKLDINSEEFQLYFHAILTKFVNEYDDMAHMNIINRAKALLDAINDTN